MDELGVISLWSVMEIQQYGSDKIGDFDLNLTMGGKFKLLESFTINLMFLTDAFNNDESA